MIFNDPYSVNRRYIKEIRRDIDNFLLKSSDYILSKNVNLFEKNLSKYLATKYVVGVKNGTDALFISLKCLNINQGDEVILPTLSATATLSAVIQVGARPVFCDIDNEFFTINEEKIERLITKKTKAIIAVNLYGQACNYSKIIPIIRKNNILLIEDCAQSLGSMFKNKKLGNYGVVSAFSFFPTKNLGALGDGGAVCTNNRKLYEKILKIRQYGWNNKRVSTIDGINSRLDEIQAIVLNIKLRYLDESIKRKKKIAEFYNRKLSDLPIQIPKILNNSSHSYHLYVIKTSNVYRNKLIKYLYKKNILVGIHYKKSLDTMPISKKYINNKTFDSSNVVNQIISLPMYETITKVQLTNVVKNIRSFFKQI